MHERGVSSALRTVHWEGAAPKLPARYAVQAPRYLPTAMILWPRARGPAWWKPPRSGLPSRRQPLDRPKARVRGGFLPPWCKTSQLLIGYAVACRSVRAHHSTSTAGSRRAKHLYRIAQEAVHNALRHGKPRSILIRLDSDDRGLILTITDDGTGMREARDRSGGLGMHIMHYRAGIIGGQITVEPGPDGGTRVRCLVPAPGEGAARRASEESACP